MGRLISSLRRFRQELIQLPRLPRVHKESAENMSVDDLLSAAPPSKGLVGVQLTSRCNLRCVYCPQGQQGHSENDMPQEMINRILGFVKAHHVPSVAVGFYGETLMFKGWEDFCNDLLRAGVAVSITSNFSKMLSEKETECLSHFQIVFMSFDTINIELCKKIRRQADPKTIIFNMHAVRSRAMQRGARGPEIAWSCVLSEEILPGLLEFVSFAISAGVDYIFLNDLMRYRDTTCKMTSIFDLRGDRFRHAGKIVSAALELARNNGIKIHHPWLDRFEAMKRQESGFMGLLRRLLPQRTPQLLPMTNIQGVAYCNSIALAPGQTRLCLEPWLNAFIMPDGSVYTCCARGVSMGNLSSVGTLDAIRENDIFRSIRQQLLSGKISDETCKNCAVKPAVPVQQLQNAVAQLLERIPQ